MKKNSSKKTSKSSLRKHKEEINNYILNCEYNKAKIACEKFMETYPNNLFGYVCYIKSATGNYNNFLGAEELKLVKEVYNKAFEVANKSEKVELKREFDDYLYDIKEVENLKKIKTDITSKEFLKNVYNDTLTFIKQNLNIAKTYAKDGKKIKNIYDFIKGIFLFSCLIFNLMSCNYLLILTVPFGIFGFINMYSFVEMNFFNKGKYKIEKQTFKKMFNSSEEKIKNIKQEINKLDDSINFLKEQKLSSIGKLPELFKTDIKSVLEDNEKIIADKINDTLSMNDIVKFTLELEENTNLKADEVINKITLEYKDELLSYINNKVLEKKDNQSNVLLMKKVKPFNIFVLIFTLFISISSFVIIINNFYELNKLAFVVSILVGFLSMIIYNIDTGKHSSLSDTYYDNLINTIFNASLIYDLIYAKITNGISTIYAFLQIPLTLLLIFIGFVQIISFFKYVHLYKKLSN